MRVEEEGLGEGERPSYRMSSKQRWAYDGMVEAAEAVVDGESSRRGRGEQEKAEAEVEERVLRFYVALLDHALGDQQYQSAIVSRLAVCGLEEGGR